MKIWIIYLVIVISIVVRAKHFLCIRESKFNVVF